MRKLKVLIALLVCVAVTGGAMYTFSQLAIVKLREKTINEADMEAELLKKATSFSMLSTDWIFEGFLSGFCETNVTQRRDTANYSFKIDRSYLNRIGREGISRKMDSFLKFFDTYHGLYFILNQGVLYEAPEGMVLSEFVNGGKGYVVPDIKDIFNSDFYRQVANSSNDVTRENAVHNEGFNTWRIGTPLFDTDGAFIGECWAEVTSKFISDIMQTFLSSDDIEASIVTDGQIILASTDTVNNGKMVSEVLDYAKNGLNRIERRQFQKWLDKGTKLIQNETDGMFINSYLGNRSYTYVRRLSVPGVYLVIVKSFNDIVRTVNHFRYQFLLTSALSVTLLCMTLMFIFREFKKEDENILKMESELDIASGIQKNILPDDIKSDNFEIHGYQKTAKSVGGDLYDYFVKDGKLHFCIGDVSGKGVPASLVMAEICSVYSFIARRRDDAADIMKILNQAVMERSDDSMICTLFIGVLDLASGILYFCNAGHNPPAVIRRDGGINLMDIKANMPIYAFENYPYKPGKLELNAGDRLFLYTDGVTEALDSKGNFFGSRAMISALESRKGKSLSELTGGVLSGIAGFTGQTEQNDDITIMCIEYKGQRI